MKKTLSFIIISFFMFHVSLLTASAQDLYIGSFYVTTTDEESQYGDGKDKWTNRRTTIIDMFNFEQPDVLGLQSLTSTQLSFLKSRLTNYDVVGDIIYNKTTVQVDTCGIVEGMPEGSTCSWARLQKDGKAFYVFNICFSSETNVATTSSTRIRTATGEINTENLPAFIVGFLGVNETKTAYSRITSKYNDCFKAPIVSAEYGTRNNFDLAANHGTDRFDFVFASKNVTIKAYGQLQYSYFTKESDGSMKRRLPSSHFPVMAKVTLP